MITDSSGNVCYDADYYPYGGERDITDSCPQDYKFTGKERDSESNLDNFGARYYASAWARFVSPDWSGTPESVPYATFGDPQTLNLYSYVRDNPLAQADLNGHCTTVDCMALQQQTPVNEAQGQAADQTPKPQQQNNDQGQQNQTIDKNKVADYMDKHANGTGHYGGQCAAVCRRGLESGGLDTKGHPGDAKGWSSFLEKLGASIVAQDTLKGYTPENADIAVFQGGGRDKSGHMEIFDGKGWVSDTKQPGFLPRHDYPGEYTIYRFPDN